MGSGFHHDKIAFGDGLQFIGRHQCSFHHLEGLAGIVFAFADAAAHHGAGTQRLGQHLSGLGVGSEAAEDGVLR